ncbi:putative reverse transcriptase domain-containing protein [Tanacetum coccineum]
MKKLVLQRTMELPCSSTIPCCIAIEGVQREQGHRIVGVESAVMALTERIAELERDNRRLRGTMSVESQRVDRLQRGMSRMQRELRQMRRLRFYDRVRVGRLEAKMPNTRSGASMTREEFEELVNRRVAEEMEAREAARTLEPLNENVDEQEGENGGNGNGGNGNGGNGNRNGNHGMNYGGFMPVARECTFQDFLKCKPHNFSGTEGVVGLTRCIPGGTPHKITVVVLSAAYSRIGLTDEVDDRSVLSKGMKSKRCETIVELTVKGIDLTALHSKVLGVDLLCTRMQGWLRIREDESNLRDKRGQQPPFRFQNTSGQNVTRAYTAGNNERKGYVGFLPYCNKCRLHHEGLCTMRCGNCKKVGHQTRDCRAAVAPNTQRAPFGNSAGIICYELGDQTFQGRIILR